MNIEQKLKELDAALDTLENNPYAKEVILERYRKLDKELAERQQVEMDLTNDKELF